MFKVGQKVVFVVGFYTGAKGVVVEVDESDPDLPYFVVFEDGDGTECKGWFSADEVEAVEEEEAE
jgi:transcription antitermination factor NusG